MVMNILAQTQLCDKTSEGFLSRDLFCTFECQLNFEEFCEFIVLSCSQGIQMTATTPSMRAVRFETGLIELELSNRIQCKTQPGGSSSYLKLFGKCQVDLNLALGQIVKHQVQLSLILVK